VLRAGSGPCLQGSRLNGRVKISARPYDPTGSGQAEDFVIADYVSRGQSCGCLRQVECLVATTPNWLLRYRISRGGESSTKVDASSANEAPSPSDFKYQLPAGGVAAGAVVAGVFGFPGAFFLTGFLTGSVSSTTIFFGGGGGAADRVLTWERSRVNSSSLLDESFCMRSPNARLEDCSSFRSLPRLCASSFDPNAPANSATDPKTS